MNVRVCFDRLVEVFVGPQANICHVSDVLPFSALYLSRKEPEFWRTNYLAGGDYDVPLDADLKFATNVNETTSKC